MNQAIMSDINVLGDASTENKGQVPMNVDNSKTNRNLQPVVPEAGGVNACMKFLV